MNTASTANFEIQRATRNPIEQEKNIMAFVNEYVSEEDIKKYGLDDLMKSYDAWGWREGRPGGFTHAWTIDRERDIYFMPVKTVTEVGRSGRDEPIGTTIYYFYIHENKFVIHLAKAPESSTTFNASPFKIIWSLVYVAPSILNDEEKVNILQLLKEALVTYGFWGIKQQVPNTIVEYKF